MSWRRLWLCCCLWILGVPVRTLELDELFEFGAGAGDERLQPGSDSSAQLTLRGSLFCFGDRFDKLYINTNGFVAFDQPPPEGDYLGKMPAGFRMIAALLGDLDNSDGRGAVHFREDRSPAVLRRAGEHIRRAFPANVEAEPLSTIVVTWEKMAAAGSSGRGDGLDSERNTFQLLLASTASSTYAVLLYPKHGLQFFSTPVRGATKVLETGFNEGLVQGWWWTTKQGTYFRISTDDETSIRDLTEKTTSGRKGVWVYEVGTSPFFDAIIPGTVSEQEEVKERPATPLQRQPDDQDAVITTFEPQVVPEGEKDLPTEAPTQDHSSYPNTETKPGPETFTPTVTSTEVVQPSEKTTSPMSAPPQPTHTFTETLEPTHPPVKPTSRDPGPAEPQYTNPEPVRPLPPTSQPLQPQVIVVNEEELDINVFAYNLETCAHNQQKCSAFADCRDYSNGYCCHCRPGFYGNGKDCVAEGKPQRMNGKVKGRVFVGNSSSPEELSNQDLHSYVVANEGRAYMAISNIHASLGPSLRLLPSLGGVIGWAFALEQPGYQNGFSIVGGLFTRQAEVIFHPGNERLSITQRFSGIDEHEHLVVITELEGHLPDVPPESSVQIDPYREIYHYDRNLITSSSNRDYTVTSPDGTVHNRSYHWRQHIVFESCPHNGVIRGAPPTQQLSVDQIFVMFDPENGVIRYAMSNKIGPVHGTVPEQNPCFTGRHGCDFNAVCRPGDGLHFTCECSAGFMGDGQLCHDIDECGLRPQVCGSNSVCSNQPGTFRCDCSSGFVLASDGNTCIERSLPVDHCQKGSHDCDAPERAFCTYTGGAAYVCSCLPGFVGDGRVCRDDDECLQGRCHVNASCFNMPGSYTCRCNPGYHGDGFQCSSSEREQTRCEHHRESVQASTSVPFFRPRPAGGQYVPQCDQHGTYKSTQCHTSIGQCWCVDAHGQEIPNTRTGVGNIPLCIDQAVIPTPVGPTPRPDIQPVAPGTHLLFAQSGKVEYVPLDGYAMRTDQAKTLLHVPDRVVIAVAFDCVEKMVYWTDITGPAISRASLSGGDVSPVVNKDIESPEGIAVDHVARLLFWTDSMRDTVEVSTLDGSQRRVLFDTDLVNPRPIVTNAVYGQLYWADWNRDGPKIEMSNMDGTDRAVLVRDDLGLPNGLTFDLDSQQLCWADAGTRKVECMDPHRRLRRMIVEGIQYPFALVSFGRNLYYTDWRREAVVAVDRQSERETGEFLPQKRSRLYGVTTTPTQCPRVYNYCSNNGGCSHLCLPRLGGFTCRCPDAAATQCEERHQ